MVNAYAQKDSIRLTTEPDARRFIHQIVLEANTQTRVADAYALMVKKLYTLTENGCTYKPLQ